MKNKANEKFLKEAKEFQDKMGILKDLPDRYIKNPTAISLECQRLLNETTPSKDMIKHLQEDHNVDITGVEDIAKFHRQLHDKD